MTAAEWIERFAAAVGVPAPEGAEMEDILRLAGEAAHASERIAAPAACWLAARAGLSAREALQLAAAVAQDEPAQ
jgi:hypothetical protein